MDGFKQFDIVDDVSDHHFLKQGGSATAFHATTDVYKKIIREWGILEHGLPDSIFVRTYETRIDLLRAAIIGATGTPYHDTMFFFDIAFPSNYPAKPPKVFVSKNYLCISPHFETDGSICLSLLNTTIGWPKERWNPSQSTILQLLLSIQALVLIDKPYRHHLFFTHEIVFLSSCGIMIDTQSKPPKNFEAIVAFHYRRRAVAILSACEAYTNNRVKVGYYNNGVTTAATFYSSSKVVNVSKEFKERMVVLYPMLVFWFKYNGASLDASIQELRMETPLPKPKVKKGNKIGILKKLREFFGSKKKKINN